MRAKRPAAVLDRPCPTCSALAGTMHAIGCATAIALAQRGQRPAKYHNVRSECGQGHRHDSAKEARRCNELALFAQAGEVRNVRVQVRYPLIVNDVKVCTYIPDFVYLQRSHDGRRPGWAEVVEDVKGGNATRTPLYLLKVRLVLACYGIDVKET